MAAVSLNIGKTLEAFGEENQARSGSRRRGLQLGIALALGIGGAIGQSCDRANSQSNIIPDRTLGNENSVVLPNFNGLPVEVIDGGAARGQNLFHSFREFNVSTGRGAYFFSPSSNIQNILTRVTGNNPSQIFGTLGTFGNSQPNLFLINPNGIIFGQNASLDIGGSFVATTANAIRLGDTGLFSASHPRTSNLLSINPSAFFLKALASHGQIVNRSTATSTVLGTPTSGLQVPDGRSLLLVGGDVRLDGGQLFAPGGRVELGGVAGTGTIGLNANGNELRLSFPADVTPADVSLTNGAEVNVRASGGGSIAINARNIDVLQGSKLRAGIASGLGSPDSKAGDIEINATGTTTVAGDSFMSNGVLAGGVGKGGDINITTGSLFVTDGGQVNSSTFAFGQSDAGSVTINARDTVSFDGTDSDGISSKASSTVEEGAVGNGGSINITTGSLFVTNGAQLLAGTSGQGNSGSVRINASDTVRFDGSDAFSSVREGAVGDGGDIEITTGSLSVTNGAQLLANTSGQGNSGSVRIRATDTVSFDGVSSKGFSSAAFSSVDAGAVGNGGNVEITSGSLSVTNGAQLSASTAGQGKAGSVRIRASHTAHFDGGAAFSSVGEGAVGDGGNVEITTGSLSVTNGAQLIANTAGQGNSGSVRINASGTVSFNGIGSNGFSSSAFSDVTEGAVGDGGNVEITSGSLSVTNGAQLIAKTAGQGNAGSVKINASGTVSFDGVSSKGFSSAAFSNVKAGAVGDGGNVEITSGSLSVTNGAQLLANTAGQGNAGSVRIRASGTVRFDGGAAFSSVGEGAVGDGGNVEITSGSLSVTNGAQLLANTAGQGNAGSVRINAIGTVSFDGIDSNGFSSSAFSNVKAGAVGNGGNVEITSGFLSVSNGAFLSANTFGQGNAGSVRIRATDTVRFDGSIAGSAVLPGGVGNGGDVEITTGSLSVSNGAFLSASTGGQGNAGSVRIRASDTVRFDGGTALSSVALGAVGNGGDIEITTGSLSVSNGAFLSAQTDGQGKAGSMRIRASDTVRFDGGGASSGVGEGAVGNGGDIEISTGSLSVSNGAFLLANTFGQGNAGSVKIRASDSVRFDGGNAASAVLPGAAGNGGDIEITTGSLSVSNGAFLSAVTAGQGKAGSVRIGSSDSVRFDGGNAFSSVLPGAVGNGGDIEITTGSLAVSNGAFLSAVTAGQGKAGSVRIRASDTVNFDGGTAESAVAEGAVGDGGDIVITTDSLSVTNGAQLSASTFGQGNAGNIKITATDTVRFNGVGSNGQSSGAFSAVASGAEGKGGTIDISSSSLSLTDAFISSTSLGTGKAGDINLSTRQNLETNRSSILASTQADDGGNIKLQVGDVLLMRNNSKISTTAGQAGAGGNGGNININANFVAAVSNENSDITANAYNGRGGNINITTQGIYGLKYRERETPLSDITASSQFGVNGEFQLDLLTNVDPSRGLAELPTDVVDATQQIDRRCTPRGGAQERSSFTITGRGGLPPSPNDPLQGEAVVTNWVSLDSDRENNTPPAKTKPRSSTPRQLVEAQGWVINEKGQVVLTAQAPKVTPQREWLSPPECNPPRSATAPQS